MSNGYSWHELNQLMRRRKPEIKIDSYGRYSKWERGSKELPVILEFTNSVEAIEGNEFGMILRIKGGKGLRLDFCIKHPCFYDAKGNQEPDFSGEYYVSSNDFRFYIGDCIWHPLEDKVGEWKFFVYNNGETIASKTLNIIPAN